MKHVSGNKSYAIAAILALYAVLGLVLGKSTLDEAITLLLQAGGLAGIRHAIAKLS